MTAVVLCPTPTLLSVNYQPVSSLLSLSFINIYYLTFPEQLGLMVKALLLCIGM